MKKIKNPVTRLNKTKCELSNGVTFTIVHNMRMEGNIDSFDAAYQSWLARTNIYTADNFVEYVKSKDEYGRIFLTFEDFKKRTKGMVIPATEDEYLSEKN
jgi:hypothetical protein